MNYNHIIIFIVGFMIGKYMQGWGIINYIERKIKGFFMEEENENL